MDREPLSSLTRAVALPDPDPEPCDPSRLESARSWFLFDLKRNAMVCWWVGGMASPTMMGLRT